MNEWRRGIVPVWFGTQDGALGLMVKLKRPAEIATIGQVMVAYITVELLTTRSWIQASAAPSRAVVM